MALHPTLVAIGVPELASVVVGFLDSGSDQRVYGALCVNGETVNA